MRERIGTIVIDGKQVTYKSGDYSFSLPIPDALPHGSFGIYLTDEGILVDLKHSMEYLREIVESQKA